MLTITQNKSSGCAAPRSTEGSGVTAGAVMDSSLCDNSALVEALKRHLNALDGLSPSFILLLPLARDHFKFHLYKKMSPSTQQKLMTLMHQAESEQHECPIGDFETLLSAIFHSTVSAQLACVPGAAAY